MNEEFALHYAKIRAKERGYTNYRIVYKSYTLAANKTLSSQAYNEFWLITNIDSGLVVQSDYGRYDLQNVVDVHQNSLEHSHHIVIENTKDRMQTITFLQVILKAEDHGITY